MTADALPPPGPCRYRAVHNRLLLGYVNQGPSPGAQVFIENLGTQPGEVCELRDVALSAASAPELSLAGAPTGPVLLQPGKSLAVTVKVGASTRPGPELSGELRFTMVNALNPQGSVPIAGTLAPVCCLTAAPDDINFGSIYQDCSSGLRTITLYNTCSQPVTLTSFALTGAGPPGPEFHLESAPALPAGGLILAPAGTPVSFTVRYAPLDPGSDSAGLVMNSVQSGRAVTLLVSMSGKGQPSAENEDLFSIPVPPKVDLLFVLDDSTSMADQQATADSNFLQLIRYELRGLDFHLGVITADDQPGSGQGRLIGDASNPKVLTPSTPNLEALFLSKVNVGAASSAPAAGLATALEALTAPLVGNENAGFLRPDAGLSIVLVSDGRDQSPGPVTGYVAAFGSLKPSAQLLSFSVVGPYHSTPPAGCTYDALPDDGRYAELVAGAHGTAVEICDTGWWWWGHLGDPWPRTSFLLNALPFGGAVTVLIDGTPVPASAYQYDPVVNAVAFPITAPPPPGSTVAIRYRVDFCG